MISFRKANPLFDNRKCRLTPRRATIAAGARRLHGFVQFCPEMATKIDVADLANMADLAASQKLGVFARQ
jgi:hypothetical protein